MAWFKRAWFKRIETLCARGADALDSGDLEAASGAVNRAFAIMEREGDERHPVFASLTCIAADVSMSAGEIDSAAALYGRAADSAQALGRSFDILHAKALAGLANADAERGWCELAAERYRRALTLLQQSQDPGATTGRIAIEGSLRRLETRRSTTLS